MSEKDTPTKGKRAKALLRRSFYSAGPLKRTRNLTQYFQLADRIAGRQRHPSITSTEKPKKLLSFDGDPQFKSPDKNSSFLLSQLVSSPSPAKTTPRKSTRTPSKLLADSPSLHTRAQTALSGAGLFSPEARSQSTFPRPSSSQLFSPVSRRQSPRVFVADSATKTQQDTTQTTPVKSPAVSTGLFPLDSPSQHTRQKTAATPTRKSVRAALFARSPAPSRKPQSPVRAVASPSRLISKFLSPSKAQNVCRMSPRRILDSQISSEFSPAKCRGKENMDTLSQELVGAKGNRSHLQPVGDSNTTGGLCDKLEGKQPVCSPYRKSKGSVQKTPSPHHKKVTKTPDSFDKWHRRKPRHNQASPAVNKLKQTNTETSIPNMYSVKECVIRSLPADRTVNALNSPSRKRRSLLLSPDKPVESPSKRRRTGRLDSLVESEKPQSAASCCGSQGFDAASSFDLSQASVGSSLDYFSVSNDEVFLSQGSETSSQRSKHRTDNSGGEYRRNPSLTDSLKSVLSPSKKFLPRFDSAEFNYTERSQSPTFCNQSKRSRNISGSNKNVLDHENQAGSPRFRRSPANRKFSPNVTAKSLMHLIQSPLLASPVPGSQEATDSPTHSRRTKTASRRSLKLQN